MSGNRHRRSRKPIVVAACAVSAMLSALVLQHASAGTSEPSTTTPKPTLVNGGFEQPQQTTSGWVEGKHVPGWKALDGWVGIGVGPDTSPEGKQYGALYPRSPLTQEVATTPGEEMVWRLKHSGVPGDKPAVMWLSIADAASATERYQQPANGDDKYPLDIADGDKWGEWYGIYQVPTGQTSTRVSLFAKYGQNNV
ncbi:hypothetical protein ACIQMR_37575, partial [Streptomyces sp. NPDC091376]